MWIVSGVTHEPPSKQTQSWGILESCGDQSLYLRFLFPLQCNKLISYPQIAWFLLTFLSGSWFCIPPLTPGNFFCWLAMEPCTVQKTARKACCSFTIFFWAWVPWEKNFGRNHLSVLCTTFHITPHLFNFFKQFLQHLFFFFMAINPLLGCSQICI